MVWRNAPHPPRRLPNASVRGREYLTEDEVKLLRNAAKGAGRYGLRDGTLILVSYRHGLRVSEATDLRWDQIDLNHRLMHVRRLKNGTASTHPMGREECRYLRQLRRRHPHSKHVFLSQLKGPISTATVCQMIARAGRLAGIPFPVHPHMLRHACGYKLANDGHDTRAIQHYLGHRNIVHTVRYTELSPERFRGFWKD